MRKTLLLPQVAAKVNAPEATLRYWRSRNEGPPMWRRGRRLVAFEDEVDAWLDEQAVADAARRGMPAASSGPPSAGPPSAA